jgi:VanZ family protein
MVFAMRKKGMQSVREHRFFRIALRILPLLLTLGCAVAIFLFSKQQGVDSKAVSNAVLRRLLAFWHQIPVQEVSGASVYRYAHFIRKLAHFTIYFVLGFLACWSTQVILPKWKATIAFVFCVLYAISDEIHQMFSNGRTAQGKDVLIDSSGALLGVLVIAMIAWCFRRNQKNPIR